MLQHVWPEGELSLACTCHSIWDDRRAEQTTPAEKPVLPGECLPLLTIRRGVENPRGKKDLPAAHVPPRSYLGRDLEGPFSRQNYFSGSDLLPT